MNRKIKSIIATLMIIAAAVAFAGCGENEPKTLEDYLTSNDEARQEVETAMKIQGGDDMDVNVSYSGNNILITSTLKTTYDTDMIDAVSKAFDSQKENLQTSVQESIRQIEESTEITGVSVDVVIKNGDGTEIWKNHYTSE